LSHSAATTSTWARNQGLRDHLRQKEQEVVSTQQRLEARGRETNSILQQLEARGQEIHALRNQLNQIPQSLTTYYSPHQKFIESVEEV